MSQENVEITTALLAAYNRGDVEAALQHWTDDVDYRAVEGAPDDHGPVRGKDALREYVQDWFDTFDDLTVEPLEPMIARGDKVIAVFRFGGRAKLSGVETDLTFAVLYTFRDGKITRGREYWTKAEALEAVGLSE